MISGKREEFGDPENQRFLRNRGLFKVNVSEKGGIFLTWRTLMGLTKSLRVGVPGEIHLQSPNILLPVTVSRP